MNNESTKRRGRPRSEASRQAILQAARDLANERGYANVTLLDIATRAGVSRQTIYRWWSRIADVYLELIAADVIGMNRPEYLALDLEQYLSTIFRFMSGPSGRIIIGLLTDACHVADVAKVFRPLLGMRLHALAGVIEQFAAQHQKQLSVPAILLAETLAGAMWYRAIHENAPLDDDFAHQLTLLATAVLR